MLLLSRSQALRHSGSVVVAHQLSCPGAFAVFPNQVSNTCLKYWIKRKTLWKEFEMHHYYMKLGTMAYLWGGWYRIVPCFKQPPETRIGLGSPPKCSYSILTVLPCGFVLAWVSETHTRPQLPEGRAVTWLTCKYTSVDLVSFIL